MANPEIQESVTVHVIGDGRVQLVFEQKMGAAVLKRHFAYTTANRDQSIKLGQMILKGAM